MRLALPWAASFPRFGSMAAVAYPQPRWKTRPGWGRWVEGYEWARSFAMAPNSCRLLARGPRLAALWRGAIEHLRGPFYSQWPRIVAACWREARDLPPFGAGQSSSGHSSLADMLAARLGHTHDSGLRSRLRCGAAPAVAKTPSAPASKGRGNDARQKQARPKRDLPLKAPTDPKSFYGELRSRRHHAQGNAAPPARTQELVVARPFAGLGGSSLSARLSLRLRIATPPAASGELGARGREQRKRPARQMTKSKFATQDLRTGTSESTRSGKCSRAVGSVSCLGDSPPVNIAKEAHNRDGALWRARASTDPRLTGRGGRATWRCERAWWCGSGFSLGCCICAGALARQREQAALSSGRVFTSVRKSVRKPGGDKSRMVPRADVKWARYEINRLTDSPKAYAAIYNHAVSQVHREATTACFSAQCAVALVKIFAHVFDGKGGGKSCGCNGG